MEITYLGHSAFRLRGKDVTILTDPFSPDRGFSMGRVNADIVTVSHGGPEHSLAEGVTGNPRVVMGPGEYEIAEVLIAGVATATQGHIGPTNTAYVFRFEDVAVCHLGDVRAKLSNEQVEELGSIDALFVPVGVDGTLGPTEAAEIVTQLEPSVVIPMHHRSNGATDPESGSSAKAEALDQFVREMGSKEFVPEPKITLTKGSIPSEVKVVVLESKRG